MKNIFTTIAAIAATSTALSLVMPQSVQAITFNFSWQGDAGYSALGKFSYDETTAPLIISESGPGQTNDLQSLSVSFFDPSNNLLGIYNTVTGGVSESLFFKFNFDTSNKTLFGNLDIAGGRLVEGEYFLQGKIGSSLVFRQLIDPVSDTKISLDQNYGAITVSQVSEPASVLSLLAFGALGATLKRKKS